MRTTAQVTNRLAIHDVDLALGDFRQRVRTAVRRDRGEATSEARAAAVRGELDAALQRIERLLCSRGGPDSHEPGWRPNRSAIG